MNNKNIFIDTNILLTFYRLSNEDIETLENLIGLIKETEEINLYVTGQLKDEFYRNRDNEISKTLVELNKNKNNGISFPNFSKKYPIYQDLKEVSKDFNRKKKALEKKNFKDIEEFSLPPDKLIQNLFDIAIEIKLSDEILNNAKIRMELGNPPGKRGSLGDAIHWESLLSEKTLNGENLFFITSDLDFRSSLNENRLDSFLEKEWKINKKSEINVYSTLSNFLKQQFPGLRTLEEYKKDRKIELFGNSEDFTESRGRLRQLLNIGDLTDIQLNKIIEYSLNNPQIYNAHLYNKSSTGGRLQRIFEGKHHLIKPENYNKFCEIFDIPKEIKYFRSINGEYKKFEDIDVGDIPF